MGSLMCLSWRAVARKVRSTALELRACLYSSCLDVSIDRGFTPWPLSLFNWMEPAFPIRKFILILRWSLCAFHPFMSIKCDLLPGEKLGAWLPRFETQPPTGPDYDLALCKLTPCARVTSPLTVHGKRAWHGGM